MSALLSAFRRLLGLTPTIKSGLGAGLRFDAGNGRDLFAAGDYEKPVQSALLSFARLGDVFYDIGANTGFFSALIGRAVGANGKVYAFEPVSENAALVARNARLNGLEQIEVLRIACSNEVGRKELLMAQHGGGAALRGASVPGDLIGSRTVDVSTIDTLLASKRIKLPDIVKIDVEGAELDVLRGMRGVLTEHAPVLVIEVDDETAEACDEKLSQCQAFLEALNFEITPLPDAYPAIKWVVRHFVARKSGKRP